MARYRSGHHVASSPGTTTGSDVETTLDTEVGRSTTTRFRLESDTRPVETEWFRKNEGRREDHYRLRASADARPASGGPASATTQHPG
jgi:hypothetical protein